jgi:hypothetical protein
MAGVVQGRTSQSPCMMSHWCHIDFANVTGILNVEAKKEIDYASNKCQLAKVNLGTGSLYKCQPTSCWVNFQTPPDAAVTSAAH